MNFQFTEKQLEFEKKAQEFAKKEIASYISQLEEDLDFRLEIFKKMAKAGLFLLTVTKELGGNFTDTISYILGLKAIAKVDAGLSVAMAVTNMVAESLALYGTISQQKRYFPKIVTGECVPLSFAITEKHAGSDAKNIQLEAIAEGDHYVLNGEKQFITNADIAGLIVLIAKTNEGVTAFLVDRGLLGMTITKKERKLGLLTANLVSLRFDHCQIPTEKILGKVGKGFSIAMSSLDSGRIGIAAQALGIAEAAFEAALKWSKERIQFGRPIVENQAISFKLADMHVKLSAARLMLYKACWMKDQGQLYTLEASEAKLYCTEVSNEIVNDALQIHGGYGYIKDYPIEKYFRDVRVTTLYEGTSEIQRLIIAKHLKCLM